ncbi:MAG: hypothetical protein JO102_02400, partial [Elusimicrobia bacterium]|nr:hypothetical protein [Elusimicrobiota bacterium]
FYRNVGILWDDSFFGNVQYFNGLKLQPDYGAEAVKTQNFGDRFAMDWSAQFFPNNDKVDGSLNGRDVESDPNATMHNTSTFRLVPTVKFGEKSSLAIGLSGLHQQIVRPVLIGNSFSINQYAADATVTAGPLIAYVEGLKQNGELNDAAHPLSRPGYDTATYLLAGARYQVVKWLNARMNYSQARYKGQNAREEEYVPGLVFTLDKNSYIMTEFDYWIINPAVGPNVLIDRSYNVIFGYNF